MPTLSKNDLYKMLERSGKNGSGLRLAAAMKEHEKSIGRRNDAYSRLNSEERKFIAEIEKLRGDGETAISSMRSAISRLKSFSNAHQSPDWRDSGFRGQFVGAELVTGPFSNKVKVSRVQPLLGNLGYLNNPWTGRDGILDMFGLSPTIVGLIFLRPSNFGTSFENFQEGMNRYWSNSKFPVLFIDEETGIQVVLLP